jgi:hypothetical protein
MYLLLSSKLDQFKNTVESRFLAEQQAQASHRASLLSEVGKQVTAAVAGVVHNTPPSRTPRRPARNKRSRKVETIPDTVLKHPLRPFFQVSLNLMRIRLASINNLQKCLRDYIDGKLLRLAARSKQVGTPSTDTAAKSPFSRALLQFAALTDTEAKDFVDKKEGSIEVTLTDFRYDFTRKKSHPFNANALYIAAQGFLEAVKKGQYTTDEKQKQFIPKSLLTVPHVLHSVEQHIGGHLAALHKEARAPDAAKKEHKRLTSSARSTRRNEVSRWSFCQCDC